ncbi:mpv17-like protein 2 isoform X3 [Microplitis mediator]|uniref:mpv17-like protein 2 isoform X3 n=1 Tax=Microplitis mediator TaxID=375433 RepID=UPI00255218E8|nr:mpv17-like protein 2 isoform X3 [Microplitis mediator]
MRFIGIKSLMHNETRGHVCYLEQYAVAGSSPCNICYIWYSWLDKMFTGKTPKIVVTKLLCDQFVLTPPLIVLFFTSMSLMEGKNKENLLDECNAKFVKTFATSCIFWLPVQFVNFLVIPPAFRVLYVSVASFCWVNILCHLKRTPVPAIELKTYK